MGEHVPIYSADITASIHIAPPRACLTHASAMLEKLRAAIADGAAEAAHFAAHSLKSGSANIGAVELANLCRQLEMAARANELRAATDLLSKIETEYAAVRVALEAMLAPHSGRNAAS